MVRQAKHDRREPEPMEAVARILVVGWLNSSAKHAPESSKKRVRELIALLQEAYVLFPQLCATLVKHRRRDHADWRKGRELAWRINAILRRQKGVPRVHTFLGPLSITWMPIKSYATDPLKLNPRDSEYDITSAVLGLVEHKLIANIRRCNCGRYFFARSSLTRFCSSACRIRFWENSEERKQRKREKAREYYLLHKRGVVKSSTNRGS